MYKNKWLLVSLISLFGSLEARVDLWREDGALSDNLLTDEQVEDVQSLAIIITKFDRELSTKIKQYPVGQARSRALNRIEDNFKRYLATRSTALKIFHENYKVRTIIVKPCAFSETIYIRV